MKVHLKLFNLPKFLEQLNKVIIFKIHHLIYNKIILKVIWMFNLILLTIVLINNELFYILYYLHNETEILVLSSQ